MSNTLLCKAFPRIKIDRVQIVDTGYSSDVSWSESRGTHTEIVNINSTNISIEVFDKTA